MDFYLSKKSKLNLISIMDEDYNRDYDEKEWYKNNNLVFQNEFIISEVCKFL